jgi:hypothetical protein
MDRGIGEISLSQIKPGEIAPGQIKHCPFDLIEIPFEAFPSKLSLLVYPWKIRANPWLR